MATCINIPEKKKGWEHLDDKYKAYIIKSYSESMVSITGLFAGFQSFVIENNRNEHTNALSLFLLMSSFGLNITICLISLINQNQLNAGVYNDNLINVIYVSVISFVLSTCCFYISLLLYTFDIFLEQQNYYIFILIQTSVSVSFMLWYYYRIESSKCAYDLDTRKKHILFLTGYDKNV